MNATFPAHPPSQARPRRHVESWCRPADHSCPHHSEPPQSCRNQPPDGTKSPIHGFRLRAAEASLTARAEARQQTFGRAWEQVARLMIAVRDGRDPNLIDDIRVQWADAATRSVAQEADAVVKLYAAGLLPAPYALSKLGYSEDEIATIAAARAAETVVTQVNPDAA